ncbi:hypothetical protein DH2020_035821 [Rehmannia glutinosa]|uniref:SAC3/GANP/THP3 conserved domain-containing protein n=1 Tax=Rehmannia glutinosa TaxID=99300 RepID=A0ABR0V7V8_REHGL
MGDSAGGNVSSEHESIVGLCPDMCPETERAERERKGDLDQYERLDGDRNLTSEFLAVKKYTRTAEREAELIRPMPILQMTMNYLLNLLDEPYDDRFLGLYNFLWDRMRAIRMDLRMQHIFNLEAIVMLEQMIRLHIIAMHELCEYTKGEGFSEGFDAHLNIEQMNKTSVELFQLYDDHRKKGIHVPSEREFRGYYALLKLDKHPGYKEEDIGNVLEYYGFSVKDFEEPYMVKENAFINVDSDFPVKRSKLVNRKRSGVIVRDVSSPSKSELYADEVKELQPKKDPEPIPSPKQSVLPVSTTQLHDEEMHDLGIILSPKGSMQKHMDKASIALTTPEQKMVEHEVQLAPASPLVLGFANSSSEHHQSRAEFAHKPKYDPVFRNSFGRSKPDLESTPSITLETTEENKYPRRAAKKRELRERKQLTANAALNTLSMGPPIWQFEVQSGSLGMFNIDRVMSERHEIQERSWSVLNPSEVVAPKLVEKNPDAKCLCWKLVLFSQKETLHEDNIELPNETALSAAGSWLHSKLIPPNNDSDSDLLVSSPDLAIWTKWVPSQSGVDPTCCLSVIKSTTFKDQNKPITGASAVLFLLSEHIPIEHQKKRLHDLIMLLPSGSRLPLLILSASNKGELAKVLGLDDIDKSRVIIFHITYLKDRDTEKLDGFLSDKHLRKGLEWLASESPPQIVVRGIKTRELVLSHLNSTLEIFDEMDTQTVGPNDCVSAFNEALDRSMKQVADAAHANPTGWPCPEINLLEESSDEYRATAWYLPSIGWSSASKTEVLMRVLNDSKLPALEDDLCWLFNIGHDIENQKLRLENCLIEYLTKTSQMMGVALAQKEAGIVLQKFTRLELQNTSYYIIPKWVSIFQGYSVGG